MSNRSNLYKNPSYTYNRHLNLNSVIQNLNAYNVAAGNAPPPTDEQLPIASGGFRKPVRQKRHRERVLPPVEKEEAYFSDKPMSHHEYIEKRRKEADSSKPYEELSADVLEGSVLNLVAYESDASSNSEHEGKIDNDTGIESQVDIEDGKQDPSTSGCSNDVDIVKSQIEQRFPLPGEPVCVVCRKYGEYICNETEDDVCSIDCKNEILENLKVHEGQCSIQTPAGSLDSFSVEVHEVGGDTWDYNRHCWTKKVSSLCAYECWKCQKPGHLAADCLVATSSCHPLSAVESFKKAAEMEGRSSSIPKDLLELYKRCQKIGKHWRTAKCNICRLSTTLATCIKCSNTFCDSAGHLSQHITANPSHQQFYSYKLKRLVKCCKSTCKVTDMKDLLACHYCFNKAFDKFYDMYSATWKAAGFSIIWNSICCEDHFEWHRINCPSAGIEDSAYIVRKDGANKRQIQLSDFIF